MKTFEPRLSPEFIQPPSQPSPQQSRFRIMILWFTAAIILLAATTFQFWWCDKIYAEHLAAGGVDDPDAVFGHFDPSQLISPLGLVFCSVGFLIAMIRWLLAVRKQRRAGPSVQTENLR